MSRGTFSLPSLNAIALLAFMMHSQTEKDNNNNKNYYKNRRNRHIDWLRHNQNRTRLKRQIKPIIQCYRLVYISMTELMLLLKYTMVKQNRVNTCIAHPQFIGNDGTFIVLCAMVFFFSSSLVQSSLSIVMMLLCNIILPEARQ